RLDCRQCRLERGQPGPSGLRRHRSTGSPARRGGRGRSAPRRQPATGVRRNARQVHRACAADLRPSYFRSALMPPAARVSDLHVCPMQTPAVPPIPHVGGPILPPGAPTVLIGNLPAATLGGQCTCVGPPDAIIKGSATVFIQNKPAARMGDTTAHGGSIVAGCPTVLIGG